MPIRKSNSRTFHRTLFAGMNQKVTLLKRNDDQQEGTVRALVLFNARRGIITKTGESIQSDMVVMHRATWHLPSYELDRVGVNLINSLDRIVDKFGRYWQPESTTGIEIKLMEDHVDIECLRVDPPSPPARQAVTGI